MDGVVGIVGDFVAKYQKTTEPKIKIVDTFLAYVLGVGLLVFAYCFIFGTFPFNSFLAGFLSTVGVFVTTGASSARCNGPHSRSPSRAAHPAGGAREAHVARAARRAARRSPLAAAGARGRPCADRSSECAVDV